MAATRSLNTDPRKKKKQVPFYDMPSCDTPAKIIADARRSVRPVGTERPYTPADHRILFGGSASQSRPPSAFSIGARHFTDERSRPGTRQRLAPIEKSIAEDPTIATKKQLRRPVKPTPPTPVQSFQDLSVLSTSPSPSSSTQTIYQPQSAQYDTTDSSEADTRSQYTLGPAPSVDPVRVASSGELEGERDLPPSNSGELELKQSVFSPVHSKRSLSADTKKSIASQLANGGGGSTRVFSAGDARKVELGAKEEGRKVKRSEKDKSSRPPHEPRKSSADLPFWKSEVVPLLNTLESTSYREVEQLCETCSSLWVCLERHGLLGRMGGTGGTKKRGIILRTVFKLLDHKEPRLLLKVAKIIIAMQVTGKNLLNVCKLLFALAKEEENDTLFKAESIAGLLVGVLMLADPLKEQETVVYGLGTVKLLASSSVLRDEIMNADVLVLIEDTLRVCCEACSSSQPTTGEMAHMRNVLIQLTGALRSLSDAPSLCQKFLSSAVLPQLASVLSDHMTSPDIVFNISRILSKLTLDPGCLQAVLQCPSLLPLFLRALTKHSHHMDIVLRVCFILGNMTAEDDHTRHQLFFQHSPLQHLSPLFRDYLTLESEQIAVPSHSPGSKEKEGAVTSTPPSATGGLKQHPNKSEAVLIKLVRLLANLSVHSEVGPRVAEDPDTVHYLLMTLANLPLSRYEELVLNVLATLNNLSYYAQPDSCLLHRQEELAELMVRVMMVDSHQLLLESTRVCGNLSRYPAVRDILVSNRVDQIMVTILDSGHREMVYCACGVLINILADSAYHESVASSGGIRKLVEVLHDFGHGDWQLASLVCKTLWNFSERLTSSVSCFGEEETIQLIQLLTNYSDEDFALSTPPLDSTEEVLPSKDPQLKLTAVTWQTDFLPVAQGLLTRIQAHYTPLAPLPSNPEQLQA